MLTRLVVLVGFLVVGPRAGHTGRAEGADAPQIGTRVILRSRETALKVGSSIVARGDIHRVYQVERSSGPWLWLVADDARGWAKASDVIPFDQALDHFAAEIRDKPQSAWAYQMRGLIRFDRKEYDKAIADNDEAIRLDPSDALAYYNRGNAFFAKHEYALAISDYNEAVKRAPRDVDSYLSRARAWLALNEHDLAIADLNEAIRLNPGELSNYRLRAQTWLVLHQYERALEDYDRILQMAPDDAAAHNGRAWIWATCAEEKLRSGTKAISEATRACMLSGWKDPYGLGTLAAAYAEAGDFLNAVTWQSRALERFAQDDPGLEDHRRRLALYQEKKPWRDAPIQTR
jgi:tetratricopeptide (TPR) repeat protein